MAKTEGYKTEPIDHFIRPIERFIGKETTGGILLFFCAAFAIIIVNTPWGGIYEKFWHIPVNLEIANLSLHHDIRHWVNDGLMAMFFFLVGLELKREFIGGELANPRNAVLPLAAAVGGMLFPALIYLYFNRGLPTADGWGIPMATDIAFVLGIMALLGKNVPISLKVFITAMAIADDLGAVLVIALFYSSNIEVNNLILAGIFMTLLVGANLLGVRNTTFYGLIGIGGVWLAFLLSGVHATVAGVLAAFTIPANTKMNEQGFLDKISYLLKRYKEAHKDSSSLVSEEEEHLLNRMRRTIEATQTPLQRLETRLYPLVTFFVMPVFALANAGLTVDADLFGKILNPITLGVGVGLMVGKFVGLTLFSWIVVKLGWSSLPYNCRWRHILGAAVLAGVGFTMSLFITNLVFTSAEDLQEGKLGILTASLIAGVTGYLILRFTKSKPDTPFIEKEYESKTGFPVNED